MNTIIEFKKDLDRYPTNSLRVLQRYFGLPDADRMDLLWLIAITQAQNNSRGTMNGEEFIVISETNVSDYDQVVDLIETMLQLEESRTDYELTTLNQDPIKRTFRPAQLDPRYEEFYGLEMYLSKKNDGTFNLMLLNHEDEHSWRFIAEFEIEMDDDIPEKLLKSSDDILGRVDPDIIKFLRDAQVISVDKRNMVKRRNGLDGDETVVLKAKSDVPQTKAARKN